MGLKLAVAPATEPITLAQLKLQCAIDDTDTSLDTLCTLAIGAARAKAENYMGASIITQKWDQTLDAFPDDAIELLRPPATAIDSITYVDAAGATQTLSSALYTLDASTWPGWVLPAYGTSWPTTRDQANAVTIRTTSGYADAASVPPDIRAWLLTTAAFIVANREAFIVGGKVAEIPGRFLDSLLDPYRVFKA